MADDLKLRFLSDPAEIAAVRLAVEQRAATESFDEVSCAEIGLCVNEAVANVIRHAYDNRVDQPIELTLRFEDVSDSRIATITIRDWGNRIDPSKLPPPPKAINPLIPGGLGMICLRELMDSVVFEPQADGMLLTLCRNRDRAKSDVPSCGCGEATTRAKSRLDDRNAHG